MMCSIQKILPTMHVQKKEQKLTQDLTSSPI
jgi:hypothetical protein